MEAYRNSPPYKLGTEKIILIEDYLKSTRLFVEKQIIEPLNLPKSNVLIFTLEDESRIAIRPSGTEPKIKFYFSVNGKLNENQLWDELEFVLDLKIKKLIKSLKL